jgi:hypothetical protein
MSFVSGELVNVSLTLLSVDGEEIPPDAGNQTIQRSVEVGHFYQDVLDNFIATEVQTFMGLEKKVYHLEGSLFFPPFRDDLICKIPKTNVDSDIQPGELIQNKNGNVGNIVETSHQDFVLVDFNHPFANKILEVEFKVLQSFKNKPKKIKTPCSL